jgi:hypothetical protein
MNKKDEARHSSLLETKSYIATKSAVWTGDTPFEDDNTIYNAYLDRIQQYKIKHSIILIGYTIDKSNKQQLLIKDLLFVMPHICTWASRPANNKPDIKGKATIAESTLTVLPDTMLLSRALAIKEILDDNAGIIDPLYVPSSRQASFYQNITNFEAVIQMPRQMIDERAAATKAMYETLNLAMKFRKGIFLDTTKRFRESAADFFSGFKQSMKIDNNPTIKYSCIGNIQKDDQTPISAVTCYIVELNKKAKTGPKGNFIFKSLPAGEYTIIFTKYGFEPVTKTVAINTGERTEIEIKMVEKVFPE